jgi:hypothetical protein
MTREYPADRWLAKSPWAYVWRIGAFFAAWMTAFWLIAAGFAHFGWDDPKWNWMLPNPHTITLTTFLVRVGLDAASGLLFGLVMYYLRPWASKPAV